MLLGFTFGLSERSVLLRCAAHDKTVCFDPVDSVLLEYRDYCVCSRRRVTVAVCWRIVPVAVVAVPVTVMM